MGITSPKFGDNVVIGSDVMVVWNYNDVAETEKLDENLPRKIDIELRDAATNTPVRTIVSNIDNNGYFIWNVADHIPVGDNRVLFIGSLLRPSKTFLLSEPFHVTCPTNRPRPAIEWSSSSISMSADSTASVRDEMDVDVVEMKPKRRRQTRRKSAIPPIIIPSQVTINWNNYPEFVYAKTFMNTTTRRKNLRLVVKDETVTPDTLLDSGITAGMFCIRYLLMLYYKKRVSSEVDEAVQRGTYRADPELERAFRKATMKTRTPIHKLNAPTLTQKTFVPTLKR